MATTETEGESSAATLNWDPVRGFEIDITAVQDDIEVRMVTVPVPADGTVELREKAIELHKLEILFKAHVSLEDGPGQVQDARVQVLRNGKGDVLHLSASVEDVETGDIIDFEAKIPVIVPSGAPETGGPRPVPLDEDDLDWDDEDTVSRMLGSLPEGELPEPKKEKEEPAQKMPPSGLDALLKALASMPTEDPENISEDPDDDGLPPFAALMAAAPPPAPIDPADQTLSAEAEARGFLTLLIDGEHLELEEGKTVHDLTRGASEIMVRPLPPTSMASVLSEWLLEQDAVADLYVGDEDLAALLDQW